MADEHQRTTMLNFSLASTPSKLIVSLEKKTGQHVFKLFQDHGESRRNTHLIKRMASPSISDTLRPKELCSKMDSSNSEIILLPSLKLVGCTNRVNPLISGKIIKPFLMASSLLWVEGKRFVKGKFRFFIFLIFKYRIGNVASWSFNHN